MTDAIESMFAIAYGDGPVLETIANMNLDTLELSSLDERTYLMVRIAALAAMDAPAVSYAVNIDSGSELLDSEDLQGILTAIAPVVGSARTASAASNLIDVFFADVEIVYETEEAADEADADTGLVHVDTAEESVEAQVEDTVELRDDRRELETV